jgi:putative membrane protein insertion efficiency factor
MVKRRASRLVVVAVLLLAFGGWMDARRPPQRQLGARAALAAIHLYQGTLSRWMPAAGIVCRFSPTCSRYSAAVIAKYGWPRGIVKTAVRLARCGPWTPAGTVDLP